MKNMKRKIWEKIGIRELTKSEKILLLLLGIVIIVWMGYRFISIPQNNKLAILNERKIAYQGKINEINIALKKESQINEEWEVLHKDREEIVAKYFPKLDQAQLIYLLDDLIDYDDISIENLNFNRPSYEDFDELQVRNMEISLPYSGEYAGIIGLINSIKKSPRKILINNLSMDRDSEGDLSGNIGLKIYSLEGIAESDKNDVIYINTIAKSSKETPFAEYEEYSIPMEEDQIEDKSLLEEANVAAISKEISPYIEEVLLDFEKSDNYFLPSQPLVKGNLMLSSNSKSKKSSLRIEYNILAVEEKSRGYIDISKDNINLKYPPDSIGIWIYSYDYSPITVGLGFKGQMGEEETTPFTEGIGWIGWRYLEISPPSNLNIYPLQLNNIYIEIPKNREDFGVIVIDKLQAMYPRNLDETESDISDGGYIFHLVKPGDTIEGISLAYYGTDRYKDEILKINEMTAGDRLDPGRVLVLKKP